MINYIDIDKAAIPYQFNVQLSNRVYTFEAHYNSEHDFFTLDLLLNDEVLAYGEKLVYGKVLFEQIRDDRFPNEVIIPLDLSESETVITFDNFNDIVRLYVF